MHRTITFNGIRKDWLYLLRGRQESPYAPINHTLIHVTGMAGAHVSSTETDVLYVSQPVGFKVESEEHEQALLDELKEWLITNNDVEIQFDNVPGKTYIGRITSSMSDYSRQGNLRSGTLVFLCKPYKYGPEITHQLTTETGTIINLEGTAETKPIFELDVTAPITYAMVMNHLNEYMMIGQPIDVESQVPFQKYDRVLYGDGKSLTGWSVHNAVDGGSVSGEMETNGTRYQAASYGTGTSWHGPARVRGITEPLKDFRVEATIGFWNSQLSQVGRVEIYLLDNLGNQVAKLAMKDTQSGKAMAVGEIRAGDNVSNKFLIDGPATRDDGWNDFYGVLRLEREGKWWKAYIGKVNQSTGEHSWRMAEEWPDNEGLFTRNVAQVVIHVGRMGTHTSGAMGIYNVSVYKINQKADGVPYIADAGDKIKFDFQKRELLINGENRKDLKTDLGGRYFTYKPGENTIALSPNAITGISKHRPAYK